MPYIDGFVLAVPTANRQTYQALATRAAEVFKDNGALRVVECWGNDVPEGKVTSFPMSVKLKPEETVVFSWIEWPDKATRDKGMEKSMADPRMDHKPEDMPFDGQRMIFGGFETLVDN